MNDDADDTPQEELRDTLTPFEAYDAVPLCPTCFNETGEDWDFCPHCNAPLGPFIGYDPFKRIFAMRFVIYQGITRPRSMTVVIGVFLFYLPLACIGLSYTGDPAYQSAMEIILSAGFAMFYTAIALWSLYILSRNVFTVDDEDIAREEQESKGDSK